MTFKVDTGKLLIVSSALVLALSGMMFCQKVRMDELAEKFQAVSDSGISLQKYIEHNCVVPFSTQENKALDLAVNHLVLNDIQVVAVVPESLCRACLYSLLVHFQELAFPMDKLQLMGNQLDYDIQSKSLLHGFSYVIEDFETDEFSDILIVRRDRNYRLITT